MPKQVEGSSPTLRGRELGQRLRELRKNAGLTLDDVATGLICSKAKVSHMEKGNKPATLRDVRDLGILYKLSAKERGELEHLAREARKKGWWEAYGDVPYSKYIGYEAEAMSLRSYQTLAVPGLLQTDAYAIAINQGTGPHLPAEELDQWAKVRTKRQALLTKPNPVPFWAVVDEALLYRMVGDTEVMRGQFQRLIEAGELSNVTLQVLPYSLGAYPGRYSPFIILELPEEDMTDVVYLENLAADLYVDRPDRVARYAKVFEQFKELALSPEDSRRLIARRLKE